MPEVNDDIIDFTAIIRRIQYPFILISKYTKLIAIYVVFAIVAAVVLKFTLPPVYSGSFIFEVNDKMDLYYINILTDIQTLAKDKDYNGLAAELKIQDSDAGLIKKIYFVPFMVSKTNDSSNNAAIVTLEMNQPDRYIEVQESIINYLESNSHYTKARNIRLSGIDSLQSKLTADMKEMESVKDLVIANVKPPVASGNGLVYNVPLDPFRAYELRLERYKEQLNLLNKKNFPKTFELIKPCVVSKKPVFPKLPFLLLVLLPIAFFVSLVHAHRKGRVLNA